MFPLLLIATLLAPAPDWSAHAYDLSPIGPRQAQLNNGLWETGDPTTERVTLRTHLMADLNGDKKPEAVLLFEYWGGGTERHDLVQVLTPTKTGYGRTAQLDGGSARDGSLDHIRVVGDRVEVGHAVPAEDGPSKWVVVRRYRLLPQGLALEATVDFRAREPAKAAADPAAQKAQKKNARALLTKDPRAGATAYLEIHAAAASPASLANAAFALMKAQSPLAKDALEAAAYRAKDGKQKGAAYYNLARYYLDQKQDEAALAAVRTSLKARPKNSATQKLLTLLQAGLGVRAIDWANREYKTDAEDMVLLTDGQWEKMAEDFGESLTLVGVSYGDLTGDGAEEALVHTNYWGGGTGRFDVLEIYDARGKHLTNVPGGDRADGGVVGAGISDGSIRLSRMSSGPHGGACCPEFTVEEVWRWKNGRFIEDLSQTTLNTFDDQAPEEAKIAAILKEAEQLAKDGSVDAASDLLLSALATKKHAAKVYALFGYLLVQLDHWSAPPVLQAALNKATNDKSKAAIYYNLGRAHQKAGRSGDDAFKESIKAFESSLKLRPGNKATKAALAEVKAAQAKAAQAKKK